MKSEEEAGARPCANSSTAESQPRSHTYQTTHTDHMARTHTDTHTGSPLGPRAESEANRGTAVPCFVSARVSAPSLSPTGIYVGVGVTRKEGSIQDSIPTSTASQPSILPASHIPCFVPPGIISSPRFPMSPSSRTREAAMGTRFAQHHHPQGRLPAGALPLYRDCCVTVSPPTPLF